MRTPLKAKVFLGDQSQVTDFAAELADLQNKYTTLEAKFNAASKVVAFYVRISADTTTLAAKGNLIYDVIVTNIGDGYDSSTGQFTAPVSGTYVFLVNCMAADSLFQELEIILDGQRVAGCVSHRPVCFTLEWTEESMPEGATVKACLGEKVSFQWTFTTADDETVVNTEWYQISGAGEAILAIHSGGHFFRSSETGLKLSFLPNAGIEVSNFTWNDYGLYRVKVKVEQNGVLISISRTVVLSLPDVPVLARGRLETLILPKPVRDVTKGDLHVQLQCGTFVSKGSKPVSVVWMTPSGQTFPSTVTSKGSFLLNLPNPVQGGRYMCRLEDPSLVSRCVKRASILNRGASVHVDETQARLQLLDAQLENFQLKSHEWNSQLQGQREVNSNLARKDETLTSAVSRLQRECSALKETETRLTSKVTQMTSEINLLQTEVSVRKESEETLRSEVSHIRSDLEDMKTNILSLTADQGDFRGRLKDHDDGQSNLAGHITKLSTTIQEMMSEYGNLRSEQQTKLGAARKVVAFYVRISADTTTLVARGNLIYDVIVTNIGDGYDSSTGQFTAPVSGMYVFLVNCMAADSLYQELMIILDGQRVAGCVSHRPATKEWDLGTSFLTVHLNAGQRIWTKNWSPSAKQIRGGDWQTFSGFLISADE
nr:hypothetical protein BaRGS_024477 [Batillaria attramentaria]